MTVGSMYNMYAVCSSLAKVLVDHFYGLFLSRFCSLLLTYLQPRMYALFWTHRILIVVTRCLLVAYFPFSISDSYWALCLRRMCVEGAFAHFKCGKSDGTWTLSELFWSIFSEHFLTSSQFGFKAKSPQHSALKLWRMFMHEDTSACFCWCIKSS